MPTNKSFPCHEQSSVNISVNMHRNGGARTTVEPAPLFTSSHMPPSTLSWYFPLLKLNQLQQSLNQAAPPWSSVDASRSSRTANKSMPWPRIAALGSKQPKLLSLNCQGSPEHTRTLLGLGPSTGTLGSLASWNQKDQCRFHRHSSHRPSNPHASSSCNAHTPCQGELNVWSGVP